MRKNGDEWRGLIATPPGSILEDIIKVFYKETNIPLEIPFFTFLHYLASFLLKSNITIGIQNQIIKPDIWSVILANSGAGKTFASSTIGKWIKEDPDFPDCASAAQFVTELKTHNNGFFLRDEFGQLIKGIEQQPHLAEMKDVLLRLYDNKKIERNTKKEQICIENPALVILGVTVYDTFLSQIGMESLLDGFSQRFSYIIAENDPARDFKDYPFYDVMSNKIQDNMQKKWSLIKEKTEINKHYIVNDEGMEAFKDTFTFLALDSDLIESFYRRIMFKGIKYALLYHILLKKESEFIDSEDMTWAGRLCTMQLKDSAKLIDGHDKSDIQKLIELTEKAVNRMRQNGIEITPRNLIRSVNKIRTVSEAKALLSIIAFNR